ncbi:MAG: hypothetical protein QF645_02960 [Planctomycetota bacterium]|nr:hypothetical protein [Planctomycetota bacterium]
MRSNTNVNTAQAVAVRPRRRPPQPRGSRRPRRGVPRQDQGGTGILILGVLGLIFGPLGIIAWIQGSSYENSCRARGVRPSSAGTAGKTIGIVGAILWGAGFLLSLTGRLPFSFF